MYKVIQYRRSTGSNAIVLFKTKYKLLAILYFKFHSPTKGYKMTILQEMKKGIFGHDFLDRKYIK